MTQHGFKRFHRRAKTTGDTGVSASGAVAADTAADRPVARADAPARVAGQAQPVRPQANLTRTKRPQARAEARPEPRQEARADLQAETQERPSLVAEDAALGNLAMDMDYSGIDAADQTGQTWDLPAMLPKVWDRLLRLSADPDSEQGGDVASIAAVRESAASGGFDLLRTRLLQTLRARGWKRVAISAPTSGAGTTFCTVNLALSLARVPDNRTIALDLNLRNPGLAQALDLRAGADLPGFLAGRVSVQDALVRLGDTLAMGLNDRAVQNSAERLQVGRCAEVLDEMERACEADTVLFDLPPLLEQDDAAAFLPHVDAVLLISDGSRSTAAHLEACEKMLDGQVPLLGVVLNRSRRDENGGLFS